MSRPSVFHNLVTNENSATELLCNLMRFDPLRRALLRLFLSEDCACQVTEEELDAQVRVDTCKPDLIIDSDEVYGLIEIKVEDHCKLTDKQPNGYFDCLLKDERPQRWLVFVVPSSWFFLQDLKKSLTLLSAAHANSRIQTRIVHWEAVLEVIRRSKLQNPHLRVILDEVDELLSSWFLQRSIMFTKDNIRTLFSKDSAVAFSDLLELIKQVGVRGRTLCKCSDRSFDLYFKNAEGEYLLWLGFWPNFWKQSGIPLCFGVKNDWPEWVQNAFRTAYGRDTLSFDGWTLGWVGQEDFESGNPVEKVWKLIDPILQAMVTVDASAA
jgi:hypothetical protein